MAQNVKKLNGVLKISVDEANLSVTLTFEATDDGDEWTPDGVIKALQERGIRETVPREKLATFFRNADARAEGPVSALVLEGHAPVQPAPDTPVWEDLPVPNRLEAVTERVLEEADPPLIFRTVREEVERKKEVTRKGALPFLKDKTEKKIVREQVEREEKVFIDPQVQSVLYARENDLLARVTPRTGGLPGRDVYGRAIPIRSLADPTFHLGKNVKQTGDEIRAGLEGFVRIGRNWVDIVPFAPHTWSVELSADRATCYLNLTPGNRFCTPPAAEEVLQAAENLEHSRDSLMSPGEIEKLLQGQIETGEPARLSISSSRDASYDIYVTDDKLEAYLNVHKGKGRGKPLSLRDVGRIIKESGLRKLDFERIKTDINAFYESNELDLTGYLLCEGTAPVPGPDRRAEYAITFDPPARTDRIKGELKKRLEDGSTDDEDLHLPSFREFPPESIEKTADVTEEQLLCTLDPPVPGEQGQDVYGQIIPAPPGETPPIRLFENVKQKESVIVTTAAGVLDYREEEGEVFLRVRQHRDARTQVTVGDDKMEAYLTLQEGRGSGSRLKREAINQELERAKIAHGLDSEAVDKALQAARAGAVVENLVVARGTTPVDQSENRVEFAVDTGGGAPVRIRKDGSADFRTRNEIVTVKQDEEVCRILPAQQQAVEGIDVLGNTVPARTYTDAPLEIGANLRREVLEDGTVLIKAEIEGEIQYRDKRLELLATHTVKGDVDMSVGNIRFPGSVIIGGTVRTGFYVITSGDVKIAGGVEGALISSDGDIVIKEGVKGGGKAVLRSKKNIMSPFVELSTVLAVGNLVLKSALVRSRIKCNGTIAFQGDKGRIVGGTIRARNGFEVSSVGSPRGVKTQLSFGQDYLVADLIEKEEKEIEKVKRRITQVDLEMRRSEKAGDQESLGSLRKEKVKLLKLMEKRGLRLFTLRERFEQHFPSRIVVHQEVHAGTTFESHGRTVEVTTPRKAITVEFNPHTGNIDISDLNGS